MKRNNEADFVRLTWMYTLDLLTWFFVYIRFYAVNKRSSVSIARFRRFQRWILFSHSVIHLGKGQILSISEANLSFHVCRRSEEEDLWC